MQALILFLISVGYVALLFGVALVGDRWYGAKPGQPKPWVYSLALGVLVTSWTFYGAVGRAAASGWDFVTIYFGQILLFIFAAPLFQRVILISKRHNLTSIADFLGARYGRRRSLALTAALICVAGMLPYMALQLKAISHSFAVLAPGQGSHLETDTALWMAVLLGLFAVLFGTRQITSSENHHGLVLAIAVESVVKLVAFLAVGLFAVFGYFGGFAQAYTAVLHLPQFSELALQSSWQAGFLAQTVLGAVALLCVPRQFHVTVVENSALSDFGRARWVFPAYLAVLCLFVAPITAAGLQEIPLLPADTFTLALPLAMDQPLLALLVYLGGFSAATGMIIVEAIALSTMLSNELIIPALLRTPRFAQSLEMTHVIRLVRRITIALILLLAYLFYRFFTAPGSLASLGLLAFAAVLQLAPALVGGLYWRRASFAGAFSGILVGFTTWAYCLLLPTLLAGSDSPWLVEGPFGIVALRPTALFSLTGLDPVTNGTVWSLLLNVGVFTVVSWFSKVGLRERLQAAHFLEINPTTPARAALPIGTTTSADLQELLSRFFGSAQARLLWDRAPGADQQASPQLIRYIERVLAGALGASSARLVLSSTLQGRDMHPEEVVRLLDDTSQAIQASRELLRASLEHLSQGVSVVDAGLRLVAWNRRYVELFGFPPELVAEGQPIEVLFRYNAERGLLGPGPVDELVARRVQHLRDANPYARERRFPDGKVIEIRGNPIPGGGFVTSYADISDYRRTAQDLQTLAAELEQRVAERTEDYRRAQAQAEQANRAKSQFAAAAVHDLLQPLNAARLYLSALQEDLPGAARTELARRVGRSLASQDSILNSLLDISRIESGRLEVAVSDVPLEPLLRSLNEEFSIVALKKNITLRVRPSRVAVKSDEALLRRVLQNFLSNAIRYTARGKVLMGLRRQGTAAVIEVWDQGPGIDAENQAEIFEEFTRLDEGTQDSERGAGLGLAIVDRIAKRLGHQVQLRSWPGRGSVFSIRLLQASAPFGVLVESGVAVATSRFQGLRVWCAGANPAPAHALSALLSSWECEVCNFVTLQELSVALEAQAWPRIMILDIEPSVSLQDLEDISQALRERPLQSEVAVLLLINEGTDTARLSAFFDKCAVLPKPLRPSALRALMVRLMLQE